MDDKIEFYGSNSCVSLLHTLINGIRLSPIADKWIFSQSYKVFNVGYVTLKNVLHSQ